MPSNFSSSSQLGSYVNRYYSATPNNALQGGTIQVVPTLGGSGLAVAPRTANTNWDSPLNPLQLNSVMKAPIQNKRRFNVLTDNTPPARTSLVSKLPRANASIDKSKSPYISTIGRQLLR